MNLTEFNYHEDSEGLLDELRRQFHRATESTADDVNLLAIDLFASLVTQHEESIALDATKIIADKLKSTKSNEILQALNVLEECMSKCGSRFRSEVGKFRFLNELIRLVSPQYLGTQTVPKVRNKILDLLLLWAVHYPKESKIKEAYDMLISRGVKHEDAKAIQIQSKSPFNENASPKQRDEVADKLKGLIQSSNPADHKAANLLIQNMVKEKERHTEMRIRRKLEVREVVENATLLKEMLDQYNEEEPCEDTFTTIEELHRTCENLKCTLSILAGEPNDSELLDETFEAIELLTETFQKYNQVIFKRQKSRGLRFLTGPTFTYGASASAISSKNALDELQEIFSNQATVSTASNVLNTLPLEPQKVTNASPIINSGHSAALSSVIDLNSLDSINKYTPIAPPSPKFIPAVPNPPTAKQSTTPTDASREASPSKKPSARTKYENLDSEMIELVSELKFGLRKDQTPAAVTSPGPDLMFCDNNHNEDDTILEHSSDEMTGTKSNNIDAPSEVLCDNVGEPATKVDASVDMRKPLSEINIDINTIMPHKTMAPRVILDEDNGLKITLNFTRDRPHRDITVLVITTTNHNSQPISKYQFEASVSRPCKLRLQSASGSELPGVKPFRLPSEDITQIMLLSNAERKPFKLVCIISYLMGDDPDPIKESLEISDLPYDVFD